MILIVPENPKSIARVDERITRAVAVNDDLVRAGLAINLVGPAADLKPVIAPAAE